MRRYNPKEIEPKWQKKWEADGIYQADFDSDKPKFIGFGMFNYPSGAGIHVGHVRNFTIPDVVTRVKRQQGYESYQPVGWDSFGLPAENFAIKTGVAPQESTKKAIAKYHDQYRAMGWGVDWTKEINTTDPEYYKWTQWCFTKLFEHKLAYQQESAQWWCDQCKTVLADEQVIGGKCWRHESADDPFITKRNLKQWFFKITEYADEMLEHTDDLDWTQSVRSSQKSWIGRSVGAEVDFKLDGHKGSIKVFTTRPDTLFGATFLVVAPEHAIVEQITTKEQQKAVKDYVAETLRKTEVQRQQDADKQKTGVFTGAYAVNPANDQKIPIWIADYVLTGYGTGAIMAVPGHDQRDFEFARQFKLDITQVVAPETGIKRENETYAEGGAAVVFDPQQQKYAFAELKNGAIVFFAGGAEENETIEEAILRELEEESGFTDIGDTEVILTAYGRYYHELKKVNRRAKAACMLVTLKSTQRQAQKLEAHEDYKVVWKSPEEVMELWQQDEGRSYDHYVIFLERAVARAIELGLDTTSNTKEYRLTAIEGEGVLINSGVYDGISSSEARDKIIADLAKKGVAHEKVNYKMRDWLISRQRYWGAPIPIIHCEKCGPVAVPEADLPVVLPEIENYKPTGGNASVLAGVEEWVNTTCPKCDGPGKRETDTMDGYVCSSWYFLRYLDPNNSKVAWDPKRAAKWMPIDFYNGGDHATAHLLYARFFTRFFHSLGLVDTPEPFKRMVFNGKIKAHDGSPFSKSKGNGIDPLEVIEQGYGADAIRLYEMFAAPVELDVLWDEQGIPGAYRFINRIWTITQDYLAADKTESTKENAQQLLTATHKTIKKATDDLAGDRYNTAIAACMELVNVMYKQKEATGVKQNDTWRFAIESVQQLVAPFAPHAMEQLWHDLGHTDTIHVDHWPKWDEAMLVSDSMTIVVQVNGKVRANISVASDADEKVIVEAAQADENVQQHLDGKTIKKTIYVPNKLVSFVV
jgi:leucyl-tRNA synthetase